MPQYYPRPSFTSGANVWKRDANREQFIATLQAPPTPCSNPNPIQPRPGYRRYQGRCDGCNQMGHYVMLCPTTSDAEKSAWRNKVACNKAAKGMTRLNLDRKD
jgi:hypothetical protein